MDTEPICYPASPLESYNFMKNWTYHAVETHIVKNILWRNKMFLSQINNSVRELVIKLYYFIHMCICHSPRSSGNNVDEVKWRKLGFTVFSIHSPIFKLLFCSMSSILL